MHVDQYARLLDIRTFECWSQAVFSLAANHGFEQCLFTALPSKHASMDKAFVVSNYAHQWRVIYDEQRYFNIDPAIHHCYSTHIPLLWEQSLYSSPRQQAMYQQASSYGLRTGLIFPIYGANGEFGMMNFASDQLADKEAREEIANIIPMLSVFKDYVFESAKSFYQTTGSGTNVPLTPREKEVINWCAAGKTCWEISRILSCSESTINFHLSNVRHKFDVGSTQLAVIKALQHGLIRV
ncbi:LuxR family transcriptional regulator [Methylobacillus arboreus]|uniref:helix-turn-helix transcriptional regulator n=1 Tax=Methylobacillus arboreus TaxID=755170 RepID=UPI001E47E752|nr:LuxR family transcriptional regulator [Methylobacillus arboreus]MCB5190920.1 LuxR family transcriptional regulator [Methylobacillus arboreus]